LAIASIDNSPAPGSNTNGMPSRAQYGGSINDSLDQQDAHRPLPSPSGSRHEGHSGGKAKSSTSRNAARRPLLTRMRAGAATSSGLAEVGSFMLQR